MNPKLILCLALVLRVCFLFVQESFAQETNSGVVLSVPVNGHYEAVKPFPTLTNKFFITQAQEMTYCDQRGIVLRPEFIEQAGVAKDSRPAEEDPEGNWGQPAGGMQLSVRFDKDSYDVGKPIVATVIFRNVTNEEISAPLNILRFDTEMVVTDEKGRQLETKKPEGLTDFEKRLCRTVQDPKFRTIMPRAQEKYQVKLNDSFDLVAPGTYQVVIHYRAFSSSNPIVDVRSGKAKITITVPPKEPIPSPDSSGKRELPKNPD
jgi:hypothetical protein